jgi:DNA ligase-4
VRYGSSVAVDLPLLKELQKASGDFPIVLHEVVSKRSSVIEGSLSVDDVNEILDELAKNMGKQ